MESLAADGLALVMLVFVLGLKHGFDADHLATIDGLTRYNARQRPALARWCGTLFSLGHGAVVLAIALGVGLASRQWVVPEWLEQSGAWISVFFLLALGVLNLEAVLATPADQLVQPVGLKGRWLGRLMQISHPLGVALVGALFALSFDTISQAALFAMTGLQSGGVAQALGLGLVFMLGMLVADGANGLWIARLIARADGIALVIRFSFSSYQPSKKSLPARLLPGRPTEGETIRRSLPPGCGPGPGSAPGQRRPAPRPAHWRPGKAPYPRPRPPWPVRTGAPARRRPPENSCPPPPGP